jgi:hypothetical protein
MAKAQAQLFNLKHACIPYDMKLKGTFPQVVDVSADLRGRLRAKFPALFH